MLAQVLSAVHVVWLAGQGSPEPSHTDTGAGPLLGALILIVGWGIGGVVLYVRARRRNPPRLPETE